jgi:hypothetical protein
LLGVPCYSLQVNKILDGGLVKNFRAIFSLKMVKEWHLHSAPDIDSCLELAHASVHYYISVLGISLTHSIENSLSAWQEHPMASCFITLIILKSICPKLVCIYLLIDNNTLVQVVGVEEILKNSTFHKKFPPNSFGPKWSIIEPQSLCRAYRFLNIYR